MNWKGSRILNSELCPTQVVTHIVCRLLVKIAFNLKDFHDFKAHESKANVLDLLQQLLSISLFSFSRGITLESIFSDWLDTPEMPEVRRKKPRSILRCLVIQARLNTLWLCKRNKSRLVTQHVKDVLVLPLTPVTQNVKPFLIHFLLSNRT